MLQEAHQKHAEQLKRLVDQASATEAVLREKLAASDAEVRRLQGTAAQTKGRTAAAPLLQLEAKLREQVAKKDHLVRGLREAIKRLGARRGLRGVSSGGGLPSSPNP